MAKRNDRNWADLPMELFSLILRFLTMPDHIRLLCVCISWRSAIRQLKLRPKPQSPWLMLHPCDADAVAAEFYSFTERRYYKVRLPLPPLRSRACLGSAHGWLITATDTLDMHLLNPLTGVQVDLPSPTKYLLHYYHGFLDDFDLAYLGKAMLSAAPSECGSGDYLILLAHKPYFEVAYARAGDSAWTTVHFGYSGMSSPRPLNTTDIIAYKGKIYTVSAPPDGNQTSVFVWDENCFRSVSRSRRPVLVGKTKYARGWRKSLVESLTGELFVVLREKSMYRTLRFEVMKLDMENNEWMLVDDLGENVIFVGVNHSMSVSALEYPELKSNCIYFTDDVFDNQWFSKSEPDVGIYDLKAKKKLRLDALCSCAIWPPPVWFTPLGI